MKTSTPFITGNASINDILSFHKGRLKLDESKSSPTEVKALAGMKVTINCVFTGGVPPYEMSLTRKGKLLSKNGSTKNRISIVITASRKNLGRYTCRAVDSIGRSMKREIMLKKTGKKKKSLLPFH